MKNNIVTEWNPTLRELGMNHLKMNTNDLLRIFVNIFGNEDDFMKEYHILLSNRLLHKYDIT